MIAEKSFSTIVINAIGVLYAVLVNLPLLIFTLLFIAVISVFLFYFAKSFLMLFF